MPVVIALCMIFAAFLLIILIRALLFNPPKTTQLNEEKIDTDKQKIIQDMSDMIKCKTVSNRDESLVDKREFEKFINLLEERFPLIHKNCSLQHLGKNGLLYKLEGLSSEKPSVCMAHYDVVPVEKDGWDKPAFDGLIEDDCIWGRGTLDTKGTLCAVMQALEQLLNDGYTPQNDLYLSFSGEEEIDGESCAKIVEYLKQNGVTPAIVLDEGGAVVENVFPGVTNECALIGIAEKGSVNLDFSCVSSGGHASTPPKNTVTYELAQAIMQIKKHPFKRHFTKPVKEMFNILGRYSSFGYKIIFANLWCFMPLLDMICKMSGGELNAMMRTTLAVTKLDGSNAYNVLPPKASFGVNMRLMEGDTIDSTINLLTKTIKNDNIKIKLVNGGNPSICSNTDCDEFLKLKTAISQTWTDAVISPYLMMACSDSRHYCKITDRVYRFSAMKLSKEERAMIHGNNERIPIDTLIKTVEFYIRFLKLL